MKYNWQHKNWPSFTYDALEIETIALEFAMETGVVKGMLTSLTEEEQKEIILEFMIREAIKSAEIEGEYHSRQDVMSFIQNCLGIHDEAIHIRDIKARGIASL